MFRLTDAGEIPWKRLTDINAIMCTVTPLLDMQRQWLYEVANWCGFMQELLGSVWTNKSRELVSLRCRHNAESLYEKGYCHRSSVPTSRTPASSTPTSPDSSSSWASWSHQSFQQGASLVTLPTQTIQMVSRCFTNFQPSVPPVTSREREYMETCISDLLTARFIRPSSSLYPQQIQYALTFLTGCCSVISPIQFIFQVSSQVQVLVDVWCHHLNVHSPDVHLCAGLSVPAHPPLYWVQGFSMWNRRTRPYTLALTTVD